MNCRSSAASSLCVQNMRAKQKDAVKSGCSHIGSDADVSGRDFCVLAREGNKSVRDVMPDLYTLGAQSADKKKSLSKSQGLHSVQPKRILNKKPAGGMKYKLLSLLLLSMPLRLLGSKMKSGSSLKSDFVAAENPKSYNEMPLSENTCKFRVFKNIVGYHPQFWNDPAIRYDNNCYNYATKRTTYSFAQPGRGSNMPWSSYSDLTCEGMDVRAQSDGLQPQHCDVNCGDVAWMVSLVVAPKYDFHWYRQHDGFWSHKIGGSEATDLDKSGKLITDPRTANRGIYSDVCGCYCVDGSESIA
ncbi:MAG TPA: hypothetical protein EYO59_10540 [Chromatiaceae bacterium]|nr:hypothetical protein [Chromatiaceae bacterium]